jgi:hypothetical protein
MTQNNETNAKLVHVNSYTKDDGTKVKEHRRGNNIKSQIQNNTLDDIIVNSATKTITDFGGNIFSTIYNTKEAFNLYKLASPNYSYNPEYVQKNGQLFNSTAELEDKKLIFTERTNGKFVSNDLSLINIYKEDVFNEKINEFLKDLYCMGYTKEEIIKKIKEAK